MGGKVLRLGVLVSGRGSNLQSIIDHIEAGKIPAKIEVVISDKKDAYALERAKKHGIEGIFIDPKVFPTKEDFEKAIGDELEKRNVELICLAGFMRILSPYFVNRFQNRIINIHPALLPSFPGLHGQKQAVDHGVKIAGCTVHFVDEGVDSGPIIIQAAVPVFEDDTEDTLSARILKCEHKIYPMAIKLIAEGRVSLQGRKVIIKDRKKEEWAVFSPPLEL
ncbi:phosphoribosylglycinamide formyltransferase 1 [Thermosulfidibacter takaii ABI70S6]|uniref:Phosphoribosylglycinamide formyltransferase n=1 Tax=Thermosulfidibacter takaii (strain DSM 17441 / JCM 13301 / NBRC 103674 / ABI70S6) TaxID=1298851 RepID=A0A0S3QR99_THET7|nr:phosphoribosylglycinamide formyltransferase [Thermosulfidibacter takaii]BAT70850.1 phosphoribosylglycinamide formyltransferase 1 [Thermosulfidibacter takaii ABI70S6]